MISQKTESQQASIELKISTDNPGAHSIAQTYPPLNIFLKKIEVTSKIAQRTRMYALPLEASIFIFITTRLSPSPPFPVVLNMTLVTQCRLGLSTTGLSLIGLYLVLKKTFLVGFLGRGGGIDCLRLFTG